MEEKQTLNTKNVPAIVMLSAGAVASITMIMTGVSTRKFLITLFVVLIIFYVAGSIIKVVLDKAFRVMDVDTLDFEDNLDLDDLMSVTENGTEDNDSYIVEEHTPES